MKLSLLLAWSYADGFWVAPCPGLKQWKARQLQSFSTCCALVLCSTSCKQLFQRGTTVLHSIEIHTHNVQLTNNAYELESPEHVSALPEHVPSCGLDVLLTVARDSCRVILATSMSLLNQTCCMRRGAIVSKECWLSSAIYILFLQFATSIWVCPNLLSLNYWNRDCPAVQLCRLNAFRAAARSTVCTLSWSKQQVALFGQPDGCAHVAFTTVPSRNDRTKELLHMATYKAYPSHASFTGM
jgi:hypothetical protein